MRSKQSTLIGRTDLNQQLCVLRIDQSVICLPPRTRALAAVLGRRVSQGLLTATHRPRTAANDEPLTTNLACAFLCDAYYWFSNQAALQRSLKNDVMNHVVPNQAEACLRSGLSHQKDVSPNH